MKDYFTGVAFPELVEEPKVENEKPKQRYKEKEPDGDEALRLEAEEFNRLVMNVLNAVRSGESELARSTTLSSPLMEVLGRLHQAPSKQRIVDFITIVRTDINNRVAQEIERILDSEYTFGRSAQRYQFPLLRGMYRGV